MNIQWKIPYTRWTLRWITWQIGEPQGYYEYEANSVVLIIHSV
jgi:hypothetical protein